MRTSVIRVPPPHPSGRRFFHVEGARYVTATTDADANGSAASGNHAGRTGRSGTAGWRWRTRSGAGCRSWPHRRWCARRPARSTTWSRRSGRTVVDLLTSRAGYGFPSEFSLSAVHLLFQVQKDGRAPQLFAAPDEWVAALARIPLLYQPGEAWLYGTSLDILGVLIAQVWGRPLPEFLAERPFAPLGMVDTGFAVPAGELDRFTSYYSTTAAGGLELADPDRADARLLATRRPGLTPSVVPGRAPRCVD